MRKIRLRVNGVWRDLIADTETVLLDLLREDLRLTGTKQSCDRA
jgi:aldehyde oxidoreductase